MHNPKPVNMDDPKAWNHVNGELMVPAAQIAKRDALVRDVLEFYNHNTRLCRLHGSEGNEGRKALNDDGGALARQALAVMRGEAR